MQKKEISLLENPSMEKASLLIEKQRIVQVALPVPLRRLFDYLVPHEYDAVSLRGKRVKVPFGKQEKMGIVIQESDQSDIALSQLKSIITVLDEEPLFPEISLQFIEKIGRYYHHPLGGEH